MDSHFGHTLHSRPFCLWPNDPSVTSLLLFSPTCRPYRPLRVEKKGNGTDYKVMTREAIDFRVELMKVLSALTELWQLQRNYIENFALMAIRLEIKCVQWWQNKGFKLLKRHLLKKTIYSNAVLQETGPLFDFTPKLIELCQNFNILSATSDHLFKWIFCGTEVYYISGWWIKPNVRLYFQSATPMWLYCDKIQKETWYCV